MNSSVWCPKVNALVCLCAHARKYSGAAKTHMVEQHGSPQRGSRGSSHRAVACVLAPGELGTGSLHGWVSWWGGQCFLFALHQATPICFLFFILFCFMFLLDVPPFV